MSRWEFFTADELRCRCGCGLGENDMDPVFMGRLIHMRRELSFPFVVTSAIRCPEHNQNVSSTGPNGPHTTGRAVDIALRGERAYRIASLAQSYGFTGLGVKQQGAHRFIHLDDLTPSQAPRPTIWSYP